MCAMHMFSVFAHTVVQAMNTNCIVLLNLCIAPRYICSGSQGEYQETTPEFIG